VYSRTMKTECKNSLGKTFDDKDDDMLSGDMKLEQVGGGGVESHILNTGLVKCLLGHHTEEGQ
jgi:hypothetical protein